MSGPLDQHLAAHLAADLGQFAVDQQLLDHGPVVRVVDRPGAQAVAERQHRVVLLEDGDDAVELLVQGVLATVGHHPGDHRHAPFGDQAAVAVALLLQPLDGVEVDAAVHGHEGHAVGALLLDQVEEHLLVKLVRVAVLARRLAKRLVKRHVAHRQVDGADHLAAHPVEVAADGQLHQGVGSGRLCRLRLAHFGVVVDDIARGADRGVDLGAQPLADADRLRFSAMVPGDDDLPLGDHLADIFRSVPLGLRDRLHLRRDSACDG